MQGLHPKGSGVGSPFAEERAGKRPAQVHPNGVFLVQALRLDRNILSRLA